MFKFFNKILNFTNKKKLKMFSTPCKKENVFLKLIKNRRGDISFEASPADRSSKVSPCIIAEQDYKFCDPDCPFMNVTEKDQVYYKINHYCEKYMKDLYHLDAHPNIYRLQECIEGGIMKLDKDVTEFMNNYNVNGWSTSYEGIARAMQEYAKLKVDEAIAKISSKIIDSPIIGEVREWKDIDEIVDAAQKCIYSKVHKALAESIGISPKTLSMLDSSIENFKKGITSEPIDLNEFLKLAKKFEESTEE